MYLIVGLGNPEEEYAKTRHNMGFNAINFLAKKYDIQVNKSKFKGLYGQGTINGEKVLLLKPQTYMNNSGESIIEIMNFYKISVDELIVIYDDIDIQPGFVKVRPNGTAGTHNGMKSIVQHIKSDNFKRVRVGIGSPKEHIDMVTHVIGGVPSEELELLSKACEVASDAVAEIVKNGIDSAMNKFNKKKVE